MSKIKKNRIEGKLQMTIKEARIAAGLSRPQMSKLFYGLPVRTIENWEAGVRNPPDWEKKLIIEKL